MSPSEPDSYACRIRCPRRILTPSCSNALRGDVEDVRLLRIPPNRNVPETVPLGPPLAAAGRSNCLNIPPQTHHVRDAVSGSSLQDALQSHLASWGLKRFTWDAEYFAWQRQTLSAHQLNSLHHCIQRKRLGSASDEVAFYDATAQSDLLPVLY